MGRRLGRPKSKLTFVRKRLRRAQRRSKSAFVRTEAMIARTFINEPTAMRRFSDPKTYRKPLIERPGQLTKRRIRPFFAVIPGGCFAVINIRRKPRRK